MKIIALGHEGDNHIAPVKWALEQAGYEVACWSGLSWTDQEQASLLLEDQLLEEQCRMTLGPHTVAPGDVIWFRQLGDPARHPWARHSSAHHLKVAEADKKFAESEYLRFQECIAYTLEVLPVRCVNKFSRSRIIQNKAVQLQLARACGLKVPKALLSNSPGAVKGFFKGQRSRTVCKPFASHLWQRPDGSIAVTGTFELRGEQLPEDEILTFAPAIYQEMVSKEFDVRSVLLGDRVYSFALHTANQALDWRHNAGAGSLHVEIIATPPEIERSILAFAKRADICFGSLDFAVDGDKQWWFLEINEQGQFLWLDALNREARLLERFCAFLTTPEGTVQAEERERLFPSLAEYEESHKKKDEALDLTAAATTSQQMSQE